MFSSPNLGLKTATVIIPKNFGELNAPRDEMPSEIAILLDDFFLPTLVFLSTHLHLQPLGDVFE